MGLGTGLLARAVLLFDAGADLPACGAAEDLVACDAVDVLVEVDGSCLIGDSERGGGFVIVSSSGSNAAVL